MKKCIVLDLDNTLWGGIVGEDGISGIKLSLASDGMGYIAFQQVLLDLSSAGMILAINSRNNFEDAIKVIQSHPNMLLKEHHFTAMRINWNDKAQNIIELAKEINIGLDSMVFLDDDPINRALVKDALPEVEVPDLPTNPADYAKFLLSLPYLAKDALTDEDKMRANLYVTERLRKEVEKSFDNREDFLQSLGIEMEVFIGDHSSVARLSQLTEKTNQFNVNKKSLNEKEMRELIDNPGFKVFHARIRDKFGDYGITNVAIVETKDTLWRIEQFLMSCRSIGRGIEEAFFHFICKTASEHDVDKISITFVPSEKNKPAMEFVAKYFGHPISREIDPVDVNNPRWIIIKNGK